MNWILQGFKLEGTGPILLYKPLLSKLERVYITRGADGLVNYVKAVRTNLLNYLSGNKDRVLGIEMTKDGFPRILVPLFSEYKKDIFPVARLQIVLTILYSTRALKLGREPDIKPITSAGLVLPTGIGKYSRSFWKEIGYKPNTRTVPKSLYFQEYHFTTKSGPNGHALWTSITDLFSLPKDLVESIKIIGGKKISEKIDALFSGKHIIPPYEENKSFRKITYFPDKEYKVRVVAILDYWSQTVLKPLHQFLARALKKIKQDHTFNQGAFKEQLKDCKVFYSIDLTAATDRFPIILIAEVLKGLLPNYFVDHWRNIMVGYSFEYKEIKKSEISDISYTVGNPMGAYSSWVSFAISHHYVIYYCCRELNLKWADSKYCLLGDDIVIGDKRLAEEYLKVIKSLGLEVSELKTHISPVLYEFAKRLVYKDQEITPFPISALAESESRSYILTSLLIETENKGWLSTDGIPSNVSLYYNLVKKMPRKFCAKQLNNSYVSERMLYCMRGTMTAGQVLNDLIRHYKYQIRELSEEQSLGILENLAVEAFADSNPENDKFKEKVRPSIGLGDLAINLVCLFTGQEDEKDLDIGLQLIYAYPLLGAYALIEEMFMNMKKEAIKADCGSVNWPLFLKTMALPWDDTIFVRRQSHLIAQSSAIVGKKLIERFDFFVTPTGRRMLG